MVTPTRTGVTLAEYAQLRDLDLEDVADWTGPPPRPVGERDGQPTYRLVDVDVARGGTTTIKDFAAEHGLDERQIKTRWPKWHPDTFPPEVGTLKRGHGVLKLYPRIPLEVIRARIQAGVTAAEFAERIGVSADTVRHTWWKRHPEFTPKPIGARSRVSLYRWEDLERLRRVCQGLPAEPEGSEQDWLTWHQLVTYFAEAAERVPGAGREVLEARRAQGVWPPGVVGADGVERWRRGEAERVQAELTARGGGSRS